MPQRKLHRRKRRREYSSGELSMTGCRGCLNALVATIHVIDIAAGLTLVLYGGMIAAQPTNPPKTFASATIALGSLLFCAAGMGILGFSSPVCMRRALLFSSYAGPAIGCIDVAAVFSIAISGDDIYDYLKKNQEKLRLDDKAVKCMKQGAVRAVICAGLLLCAFAELVRFLTLPNLRTALLHKDRAKNQVRHQNQESSQPLLSSRDFQDKGTPTASTDVAEKSISTNIMDSFRRMLSSQSASYILSDISLSDDSSTEPPHSWHSSIAQSEVYRVVPWSNDDRPATDLGVQATSAQVASPGLDKRFPIEKIDL